MSKQVFLKNSSGRIITVSESGAESLLKYSKGITVPTSEEIKEHEKSLKASKKEEPKKSEPKKTKKEIDEEKKALADAKKKEAEVEAKKKASEEEQLEAKHTFVKDVLERNFSTKGIDVEISEESFSSFLDKTEEEIVSIINSHITED